MKKLTLTLLFFFLGINCFANQIDVLQGEIKDLQGEWKLVSNNKDSFNVTLTFSNDTLFIDDEIEGFGYTYKIKNDIIEVYNLEDSPFGFSEADFYIKLLSDIGDDNLTIAYIDRETGYGINEAFTFVKEIK